MVEGEGGGVGTGELDGGGDEGCVGDLEPAEVGAHAAHFDFWCHVWETLGADFVWMWGI